MPEAAAPAAEWRQTAITFPRQREPALGPVELTLRAGERVLLLGPSGSGKSSLLLALTGLIPANVPAKVGGETRICSEPTGRRTPAGWSSSVAQYFQDADQVLCGMRVEDEIAFCLENRALPPDEIRRQVGAAMARLGLPDAWRGRRSLSMSGGERQMVALAAVLAQGAPILLADEPTAHLSPEAAEKLHTVLAEDRENGSCLIVDHRLDGLVDTIDRVAVIGRCGTILAEGPPRELFREHRRRLIAEGIWRPAASDLDACLASAGVAPVVAPLSVDEALAHLEAGAASRADIRQAIPAVEAFLAERMPARRRSSSGTVVARLEAADCAPFLGPTILRNVDFAIREGEVVALVGQNGAGKTTLGASLAGLLRVKGGRRTGEPGAVALQHPEDQFATGTAEGEIEAMLPKSISGEERARRVRQAFEAWHLGGLEKRHPFTLSEGQKRRLALACLDAADRWPLLVLDEPTAGLDAAGAERLATCIEAMRGKGRAVALITHDMDFALRLADRVAVVGEGGLMAEGAPTAILLDTCILGRAGLREPAVAPAMRWLERALAC